MSISPNLNRRVRSRLTPPERKEFVPRAGAIPCNMLNLLTSHNLTKMAVVKLRRRKRPLRAGQRPETGQSEGAGGSEARPRTPAFCGLPTARQPLKKNVPTGRLGGAEGTRTLGPASRVTRLAARLNPPRAVCMSSSVGMAFLMVRAAVLHERLACQGVDLGLDDRHGAP